MGASKSRSTGGGPGSRFPHQMSHTDFHQVAEPVSLKQWKNNVRVKAGFHPWITCKKTRLENMTVQPWACQGRTLTIFVETYKNGGQGVVLYHEAAMRSNTVEMPGCFNPADVTTYFPEGIPILDDGIDHYFACLSVIGSRNETAVLQWITNNDMVHIAVVRLTKGVYRTVAVYIPEESEQGLLYEAVISPAQNQFLLRPGPVLCHRFCQEKYDSLPNNAVKVIDLELGTLKLSDGQEVGQRWHYREADNCYEEVDLEDHGQNQGHNEAAGQAHSFGKCLHVTDLYEDHSDEAVLSYDPRFPNNRIAMGALTGGSVEVYDIAREEVLCRTEDSQRVLRLVHSPDGSHLAALIGNMVLLTELVTMETVIVFNSDTLEPLQEFTIADCCSEPFAIELHRCHILPEFSCSGQYISVPKVKYSIYDGARAPEYMDVEVYTVPVEMSLQNLCRVCVLNVIPVTMVTSLPLPKPLQNYLLFKRTFTML